MVASAAPTASDSNANSDQACTTGHGDQKSTGSGSSGANATSANKPDRQDLLDCHFAGLDFAAGPSSGGGFGAQLKGSRQYIVGSFNAGRSSESGFEIPNELVIGYDSNSSWNSKTESRNQISVDLRLGLDGAIMTRLVQPPVTDEPPCLSCLNQYGSGGDPIAGYGIFADGRYRYGTFGNKDAMSHVNQFLAGGGVYFVWQKGLIDQSFVDIWPGVTLTYYTPVSTDTPVVKSALPDGVKADFLQAEFKTGFAFPIAGRKFRLSVAYDGSLPTTGFDNSWQSLFDAELSVTFSGPNLSQR